MSVEKLMMKLEEEYKSTQYLVEEKLPKELAAKKKSCNNIQVTDKNFLIVVSTSMNCGYLMILMFLPALCNTKTLLNSPLT